jgi:hypothetical protein
MAKAEPLSVPAMTVREQIAIPEKSKKDPKIKSVKILGFTPFKIHAAKIIP